MAAVLAIVGAGGVSKALPKGISLPKAAERGDVDQVQSLVAGGADVNLTDASGLTPPALGGHTGIVDLLVASGAYVDAH